MKSDPPAAKVLLLTPRSFAGRSSAPVERVEASLREGLGRRLDPAARGISSSRQIVAGSIEGGRLHMSLQDINLVTSRKSWNIAFDGTIESDGTGSLVAGYIDIPDRRPLDKIIALVKLACVMALAIAVVFAIRDWIGAGTVSLATVLKASLAAGVGLVIAGRIRDEGLAAAARDADILVRFLDERLSQAGGRPGAVADG